MPTILNRYSSRIDPVTNLPTWFKNQRGYAKLPGEDRSTPLGYFVEENKQVLDYGDRFMLPGVGLSAEQHATTRQDIGSLNRAYDRYRDAALGDKSQIAATAAEWAQSSGMIISRLNTLHNAARALRRGNLKKFASSLKVKLKPSTRRNWRDFGGTWLEYWFGWAPLYGDLYNAVDVLQRPLPFGWYYGHSGYKRSDVTISGFSARSQHTDRKVRVGGKIQLENPNLFLANQIGIVNPVAVAWELLPFSFAVDWVVNIGGFVNGFTDFVGVRESDPYRTWTTRATARCTFTPQHQPWRNSAADYSMLLMRRQLGPTRPQLHLDVSGIMPKSWTRAATMVSLLLQQLRG